MTTAYIYLQVYLITYHAFLWITKFDSKSFCISLMSFLSLYGSIKETTTCFSVNSPSLIHLLQYSLSYINNRTDPNYLELKRTLLAFATWKSAVVFGHSRLMGWENITMIGFPSISRHFLFHTQQAVPVETAAALISYPVFYSGGVVGASFISTLTKSRAWLSPTWLRPSLD